MTIRTAAERDVQQVLDLVQRTYRGDSARGGWTHEADLLGGQRTDAAALADIIADPAQRLLLAEVNGRLVGCVQITDKGGGTTYLGLLTVDPDRQAAGLGRRLLAEAERSAATLFGATRMEMTVIRQRAELIAYYERRGYALTGEERPFPLDDPRFGLPQRRDLAFVVLEKPLSRS
ncbi:GNAT family N-acetyltransferase [Sphingomonas sp.]|uniref:GNAT family N-acetyltransferase n=1 Tax=Sphingomonas sp. TaxID=28214 RepID=UPI002DEF6783|nr:GNAT family N-acetyltransferase [Sphingomonas sp.]